MPNDYVIYPSKDSKSGNRLFMPVLIFLVGAGQNSSSYETFFQKLTSLAEVIVYVLDTDPDSEYKSLPSFLTRIATVPQEIQEYYGIEKTSSRYFLAGHGIGGTIALNAVYPSNFHNALHSITLNPIDLPLDGFIAFDPIDGDGGGVGGNSIHTSYDEYERNNPLRNSFSMLERSTSSSNNNTPSKKKDKEKSKEEIDGEKKVYSLQTKYDSDKDTIYVTSHGQVNPYPMLFFVTSGISTSGDANDDGLVLKNPLYKGEHIFKAITKSEQDQRERRKSLRENSGILSVVDGKEEGGRGEGKEQQQQERNEESLEEMKEDKKIANKRKDKYCFVSTLPSKYRGGYDLFHTAVNNENEELQQFFIQKIISFIFDFPDFDKTITLDNDSFTLIER
jgi:hypothetical protein